MSDKPTTELQSLPVRKQFTETNRWCYIYHPMKADRSVQITETTGAVRNQRTIHPSIFSVQYSFTRFTHQRFPIRKQVSETNSCCYVLVHHLSKAWSIRANNGAGTANVVRNWRTIHQSIHIFSSTIFHKIYTQQRFDGSEHFESQSKSSTPTSKYIITKYTAADQQQSTQIQIKELLRSCDLMQQY
jgi:hypothetical protein